MKQKTHLVCKLPGVAYDQSSNLLVHRLKLLEDGKHEHGSLPHPRLGLTDHIHAKDGLWDALVLHCASTQKNSMRTISSGAGQTKTRTWHGETPMSL